jgi:methionyl-tRNA formyltransferase
VVKTLFFGTPEIAVPFLHWLSQHSNVVGVVCRPDEPVGRGYTLTPPPTKVFAEKKGIPVFQPIGPWTDGTIELLKNLGADIGIVVAYGRILPRSVFSTPTHGCVNIHFSLLPQYRGAAPMQWSLMNGETQTGVSAFWLEEGLDSGPLFHQRSVMIARVFKPNWYPWGLASYKPLWNVWRKESFPERLKWANPLLHPFLKKRWPK